MIDLVNEIEEKVDKGELKKINDRFSFIASIQDAGKRYDCRICTDIFLDTEDIPRFRVHVEVGIGIDYRTLAVSKLPEGELLYYSHADPYGQIGEELDPNELIEYISFR